MIDANEVALVFTRSGGIWTEEGEKLPARRQPRVLRGRQHHRDWRR